MVARVIFIAITMSKATRLSVQFATFRAQQQSRFLYTCCYNFHCLSVFSFDGHDDGDWIPATN